MLNKKLWFCQGSLSYDDGDGNENGKKAIGLDLQNNNSALASRFFLHFFSVAARPQRESAKFHILSRSWTQDIDFFFFSWTLIQSFRIQLQKIANIWRTERVWISATKFEVARIHFLSDVCAAVAVTAA